MITKDDIAALTAFMSSPVGRFVQEFEKSRRQDLLEGLLLLKNDDYNLTKGMCIERTENTLQLALAAMQEQYKKQQQQAEEKGK